MKITPKGGWSLAFVGDKTVYDLLMAGEAEVRLVDKLNSLGMADNYVGIYNKDGSRCHTGNPGWYLHKSKFNITEGLSKPRVLLLCEPQLT